MPEKDAIDMLKELLDSIAENCGMQDKINKLHMEGFNALNTKIDLLKERIENLHTPEELAKADNTPIRTKGLELL